MINPRVKYSIGHNEFKLWLDNTSFPFIQGNEGSRKAALEKLMQHGGKVIAALEQHAGRPLTDIELMHGVQHVETRTAAEVISQNLPDPPEHFDSREQNPYTRALEMGLGRKDRKLTREEALKEKEAAWNKAKAEAEAKKEFLAQPQRAKARARIESLIAGAKYDGTLTQSDIDDLMVMRHAVNNDEALDEVLAMEKHWHRRQHQRVQSDVDRADAELTALKLRRDTIASRSAELELPKPVMPEAPEFHFPVVRASDLAHPQFQQVKQAMEQTNVSN
jgi:hypothetical protein